MGNPNIKHAGKKTQFSKENQPAIRGRRKNQFDALKDQYQLSANDIGNIIIYLSGLTSGELKNITKDKQAPAIMVAFAKAFITSIKYGELNSIETMLNRSIGKPSENVNLTSELPITINVVGIKNSGS